MFFNMLVGVVVLFLLGTVWSINASNGNVDQCKSCQEFRLQTDYCAPHAGTIYVYCHFHFHFPVVNCFDFVAYIMKIS